MKLDEALINDGKDNLPSVNMQKESNDHQAGNEEISPGIQLMEVQKGNPAAKDNTIKGIYAFKAPISYKDSLIGYNGCYGIKETKDTRYINDDLA